MEINYRNVYCYTQTGDVHKHKSRLSRNPPDLPLISGWGVKVKKYSKISPISNWLTLINQPTCSHCIEHN